MIALEAYEPSTTSALPRVGNQYVPTLLLNGTLTSKSHKSYPADMDVGHVTRPVGPYKLARFLLSVIRSQAITRIQKPVKPVPQAGSTHSNRLLKEQSTDLPIILDLVEPAGKQCEGKLVQRLGSMDIRNAVATLSPNEAIQEPRSTGGLPILAVDDNEISLQLLQRFLSKRKIDTVDSARDGFEAVAAVQKALRPYDVVFLNIFMPGMDGFEATRRIRQYENERVIVGKDSNGPQPTQDLRNNTRSYVVALTGLGAGRDREEATKCGFDDSMTKPIPFQKVGKLLKELNSRAIE